MTGDSLPPPSSDHVIDVQFKHVLLGLGVLLVGSFAVGSGIVLVRDYVRSRRQAQLIKGAEHLIVILQHLTQQEDP